MKHVAEYIVKNNLCVSCGACYSVCPTQAIQLSFEKGLFVPKIDEVKCINCSLCLKVCPSYQVDLQNKTQHELFRGQIMEAYVLKALDLELLKNSTSGGFITQTIVSLLEQKVYDKACVLDYDLFSETSLNRATLTISGDVKFITQSARSKYIPASIDTILDYIPHHLSERIIIIGTSCQFEAIKSYFKLKKIDERNYLFLGLFCDKTLNYNIYNYFRYKFGPYKALDFRSKKDGGWPGNVRLVFPKKELFIDRTFRMGLKSVFQLNRCRYCFDKLNRYADISCGDCYIERFETLQGNSNILIRTQKGQKAFELIQDKFNVLPVTADEIIEGQELSFKETNYQRGIVHPFMYVNKEVTEKEFIDIDAIKDTQWMQYGSNAIDLIGCKQLDDRLYPKVTVYKKIKRMIKKWLLK